MKTTNIESLLRKTRVEVAPETFTLVALKNEDWLRLLQSAELSPRMTAPFMILKDRWEVTLLLDQTDFETMRVGLGEARIFKGLRLLTFDVELDFAVVGFLAFIAEKLALAGVPILSLAAFSRDHLLVKQEDLAKTLIVLGEYVEELC